MRPNAPQAVLGFSWRLLGSSWGPLGGSGWAASGSSWLGASWGVLGLLWMISGSFWRLSKAVFGPCFDRLSSSKRKARRSTEPRETLGIHCIYVYFATLWSLRGCQNGSRTALEVPQDCFSDPGSVTRAQVGVPGAQVAVPGAVWSPS